MLTACNILLSTNMNSIQKTARLAGLLYLIDAIAGGFGHFSLHGGLIVPGDATATVNNIKASATLLQFGIVSNLVDGIFFILLPLVLYKLLNHVNKNHAVLMVVFAVVSVPIACFNMVNQFAALQLANGADYLKVFDANQLHALVMFFLDLQSAGVLVAQIFFGLWLLPLGYLVFKSDFLPKVIGVLLIIACFVYLAGSAIYFLAPDRVAAIQMMYIEPAVAEMSLCLWLLIKGVKVKSQAAMV